MTAFVNPACAVDCNFYERVAEAVAERGGDVRVETIDTSLPEALAEWGICNGVFVDVAKAKPIYENECIELVAEVGNTVVGLLDIERQAAAGLPPALGEDAGTLGMIWDLAVHPDYRRRGIASEMLAEASSRARGMGVEQLEAWTRDGRGAEQWYTSQGFGEADSYYHVTIEGERVEQAVKCRIPGLTPIRVFAHCTGNMPPSLRRLCTRVHECRLYRLQL